jgi:hypothetical protein
LPGCMFRNHNKKNIGCAHSNLLAKIKLHETT